ncbi:hypothetical protein JCM31447_12950 [Fluviispira sanaruensis]|uniref:PAS domain-containing protein n=2 Tax=Fluviispira sanaruensis TaxID=2493639 RepID=A0A4P2VVC3_FLUSA|nr:hypothetical protein JCM31447_12950 [Fluviispira sanaruensis]
MMDIIMILSNINNYFDFKEIHTLCPFGQNDMFSIVNILSEVLFASEGLKNFLGITDEEIIGKSSYDFTLQVENHEISETHGKLITEIGIVTKIKFRLIHKSGELFWVESTAKSFTQKNSEDTMFFCLMKQIHCF